MPHATNEDGPGVSNLPDSLWTIMAALDRRRLPYTAITVVRTRPPSSARPGMRAVVTAEGALHGFVGGQCTRRTVVDAALAVLREGSPRLLRITPDPTAAREADMLVQPMTCLSGGEVDLFLEPHYPPAALAVVGDTPIAEAVATLAQALQCAVYAYRWHAEGAEALPAFLQRMIAATPPEAAWVVATQGEYDEDVLLALASAASPYLAVVASPRRAERLRAVLTEAGVPEAALARLHAPAGLDLGAVSPPEIALSILAEWLAERHRQGRPALMSRPVAPLAPGAVDPVCGMAVDLATTPYRYRYRDTEWGFCARGCLEAFRQQPEAYLQSRGSTEFTDRPREAP